MRERKQASKQVEKRNRRRVYGFKSVKNTEVEEENERKALDGLLSFVLYLENLFSLHQKN